MITFFIYRSHLKMETPTVNVRPKPAPPSTPKDDNIVKIAVQMSPRPPQFIGFNQKLPLLSIIQELCDFWGLTLDPVESQYALRFNMEDNRSFVSERNRLEVKNGFVLELGPSPSKITQVLFFYLNCFVRKP